MGAVYFPMARSGIGESGANAACCTISPIGEAGQRRNGKGRTKSFENACSIAQKM